MVGTVAERLEYETARDSLQAIEHRLLRQRDALLQLTAARPVDCDALPGALASILEVAAAALAVSRASIWRYDADRTAIVCVDLFDAASWSHLSGARLSSRDFPSYFNAIRESEVVAVNDAQRDPRTAEFTEPYLRPFNICSMMDVPLHLKDATIGVICFEHVAESRVWTTDERAFGIAISNLVSLAFERCERARAESALALQAAALNAAANAMVITDRDATIVWANPAFAELTGYSAEEAIGTNVVELLRSGAHSEEFFEQLWDKLRAGKVWQGEFTNRKKDGTICVVDQTITPVRDGAGAITHFVSIKRDLTTQRELEAQYRQAQKMEVVGRLAGGVAHDFNNMLTVINGTAELAMLDVPPKHPLHDDLDRILESGKRAASLTRQLLMFSRRQLVHRQPLSVETMLGGVRSMLQRLIGEDVHLEVAVTAGTGSILADQSQFEQVILNLAVNARDAMPTGGTLRIAASAVEITPTLRGRAVVRVPGRYVKLTVGDTGCGMTPEIAAKIFEPFFTTKESGKGTGLGLATVYAIVEQSGGAVAVQSAPQKGTTFTIHLPQVAGDAPSAEVVAAPAADGSETILLVEDDAPVRDIAARSLKSAGYRVLVAADGASALELLGRQQSVSLLVTDVVMPGLGGRDLAAKAVARRPQMRVLFSSGYTDDTMLAHGIAENTVQFIAKPYSPQALARKVREVLDAPETGGLS